MSGNENLRPRPSQRGSRGLQWSRGDNSLGLDEFGILRGDEQSRSSDSVPVEDPSLNLTDDDTSAKILEGMETSENEFPPILGSKEEIITTTASESEAVHDASAPSGVRADADDSNADATAPSDDVSPLSGSQAKRNHRRKASPSPQPDETESLTEFEEIERLIQANTVQDSDGDLSDLPIDFEERILSRRTSRESSKSSRSGRKRDSTSDDGRSKVIDDASHSTSSPSFGNLNTNERTVPKLPSHLHQDTGYGSEANMTQGTVEQVESSTNQEQSTSPPPADDDDDDYRTAQPGAELDLTAHEPQNLTGLLIGQAELLHSTGTTEDDDVNEGDTTVDNFVIPTNRSAVGDTNQPSSLVATFGTTEDFEKLLQQQLDDIEGEHSDQEMNTTRRTPPAGAYTLARGESPQMVTSAERNPLPTATYRRTPSPSPRGARNKLKLSSRSSSHSPRESTRPSTKRADRPRHSGGHRGVRSPAASRARRANNVAHGRPEPAPLYRESSDDLSVRSDMTRSELRHKLKEDARTRKQDEEFVKELKSNYDDLLMKFAQAENTIDHLRLGAKINLFASVPRASGESPALPFQDAEVSHQGNHQQQGRTSDHGGSGEPHSAPRSSRLPSAGSDTLVESSLQLPAAASKEFLKVALQLQAKDVQDKVDSFTTLLTEAHLSPTEQGQVMGNIEEAMRDLERDYLTSIDQHAAEQRRVCIATGGSIDQAQAFDPDRTIEGDLLRLGQKVKSLRNHISAQTETPQYSPSPRGQGSREEGERSYASSPDADVDERFNELLQQYNHAPTHDDGHTTAPSHIFSSPDEDEERESPRHVIPNRFLEPPSTTFDSSIATQDDSPRLETSVQSRRPKSESSATSLNGSLPSGSPSPTRRSNSKLPRPIKSSPNRRPSPTRKSTPSTNGKSQQRADKGTDSGFVGSESSRQSAGLIQPAKVKLVARPAAAVDVKTVPATTPPRPAERRGRPPSRTPTTQPSEDSFSPDRPEMTTRPTGYMGRVGIFKPPSSYTIDDSADDVSTTSTVREMLLPHSRSYSTSPPPSSRTKPHFAPFPRGSRGSGSVKSKDSTKRSVASSTRDSTLDMIRGEISKLRDEIKSAKSQGGVGPLYSSTPRRHPVDRGDGNAKSESDAETLQAIHSDVKALKDEVKKQARQKKGLDGSETYNGDGNSTGRLSRSDMEGSTRGRRSRRSRSLGRDNFSDVDGNRKTSDNGRGRSRSQERRAGPWTGGYWTYVPPTAPMWGSLSAPIGRTYTRVASPVQTMVAPSAPTVCSVPPVVHTAPIIGPPSNVVYVEPQTPAQGRVYMQTTSRTPRIYSTPSKPQASVYISPKGSSSRRIRKANVYIVDSDDEEPLRRSHLSSGLRRSSSLTRIYREPAVALGDSRLNDSIDRAERSADQLRRQSRSMYRSVRDNVYRAQLLADTM